MAFGTGSAMAHRAVDAVMGPRTIQHETVVSEAAAAAPMGNAVATDACGVHSKAFQDVSYYYRFSTLNLENGVHVFSLIFVDAVH